MLMDFYWPIMPLLKVHSLFWVGAVATWVPLPSADSWQLCAPRFASPSSPFWEGFRAVLGQLEPRPLSSFSSLTASVSNYPYSPSLASFCQDRLTTYRFLLYYINQLIVYLLFHFLTTNS